ncbi:growth arrest-specific protein 7 isoform X4 [Ailuropoda melanoleuca]|uniref:growth arrest-specific protein 7 isoform X3 n=2 Tax=Ailuropoda melanoleuca TaxID=9646 RepID=UPI001494F1BA|nr:growth arrest-specific protein 7 isoform X3 [Ailuropoda melanoleuca]XP_034502806.1 growth arrest-specific protein 7 isoform X4 [Ailuropoda melanoleuca]
MPRGAADVETVAENDQRVSFARGGTVGLRSLEWSPLRPERKATLSSFHLAGRATCLPRAAVTMSTRPPMRPPGNVPAVLLGFQPALALTGALCLQQNLGSSPPGKKQSKENTITVNCVTFPHPDTMPEQQLLKPTEWSYCDYFWADKKDPQGNGTVAGFELLLQKQLKGKQMQKEMSEFIRERIKIEEEYAKNLAKLSQNSLAAQEEGSLGEAWAQVKKSLADEAAVHLKFSAKLHSEVEKPLMNFRENFKKDMKKCDHHIADLRKQLASRYAAVEKARKALTERQRDLEVKTQQLEIKLSNKTEEDIKKARRKSTQAGDDLMRCVDLYNQAQSKWFEEMVTTTLVRGHRGAGAAGGGEGGDDPAALVSVHAAAARDGHVQPKYSRACGPTASKSGPSQRQGAVGQRAQDGQHPSRGHGDLDGHARPRGSCRGEGRGVPWRGGGCARHGARCRVQLPSHPLSWSWSSELVIPEGQPCWELPVCPGREDGPTALPLSPRLEPPDSCAVLTAPRTNWGWSFVVPAEHRRGHLPTQSQPYHTLVTLEAPRPFV